MLRVLSFSFNTTFLSTLNTHTHHTPLTHLTIYSVDDEYIPKVEFFFVSLAALGVLVGLYLNVYDRSHGGVFNNPTAKIGEEEEEGYESLLGGGEGRGGAPGHS